MSDICIVTPYRSNNYGTRLQSYALGAYLKKNGVETYYLESFRVLSWYVRHPVLLYARIRNKLMSGERKRFFKPSPYLISEERCMRMKRFSDANYTPISITGVGEWSKAINSGMIFLVGSDIVWQPAWGYPSKYFLDFAVYAGLRCFSYASSIGAKKLPKKYFRAYKRYLSKFEQVSVREEAAARMLSQIVTKPIHKVIDPTLLLNNDDWDVFASNAKLSIDVIDKPYVLCYFVMDDNRYWEYVHSVSKKTGLQIVVIPMHYQDEEKPYTILLDGTPYEFVWLIKHAEFVVTDSFHACCFSMQFEKEFYLLRRIRPDEDDKYDDFLGRYKLNSRVVSEESNFTRNVDIDYTHAKCQLAKDRADSYSFLEYIISN